MSIHAPSAGDLYGKGLSFPVRVGLDGGLITSEGERNVRESICLILRTGLTERVERPAFGCGLTRFMHEPGDLSTLRLIQEEVMQALVTWEPRIKLSDVRIAANPQEPRAVDITVVYTLVATRESDRIDMTVRSGS